MLNFTFHNDTELIFGKGTEAQTGYKIKQYGKKVLVCSYGDADTTGIVQKIYAILAASGVEYAELSKIKPNPEIASVYEGIRLVKEQKLDFILAVGGGSIIDTAKAIAAGVMYSGDVWDLYTHKSEFSQAMPTGVILTYPATGSESSNGSVITNQALGMKLAIVHNCLRPRFAIMNPEFTLTLPKYHTFCGAADIMSHVFERYFSRTEHTDLTDRISEAIVRTVIRNSLILLENPADYDARSEIMFAGTLAHNDLVGMGRTQDWASHMISMEIGALYDATHGAALAVITPWWMRYVYENHLTRFIQFAMRIMDVEYDIDDPKRTALEGIYRLEAFFRRLGLPTTLKEIGITSNDRFAEIARKYVQDYGVFGEIKALNEIDVVNILNMARGVI